MKRCGVPCSLQTRTVLTNSVPTKTLRYSRELHTHTKTALNCTPIGGNQSACTIVITVICAHKQKQPQSTSLGFHFYQMTQHNTALRKALFERFSCELATWRSLSTKYSISVSKLRTAYAEWTSYCPNSNPQSWKDVHFEPRLPGRPCSIASKHETVIAAAIRYYADN